MDDGLDTLVVGVRADTAAFAADVAAMRAAIEGPLVDGAEHAGHAIESALLRAVRTGRLGFDDLRRTALSVMAEIARSAISAALPQGKGGGLLGLVANVLGAALGAPGRATGGPVGPGRAYMVGERGPELFVPTSSGRIEAGAARGGRDIRITVNVGGQGGGDPARMAASGRQIAQAVRRAIEQAEG
ncbi:MAG: tail tape measure protein [Sphingopyxis sp.]